MGYLFVQSWIWLLVAFLLGLIIGFVIAWVARRKHVDVKEERIGLPAREDAGARTLRADADGFSLRKDGRHGAVDPDDAVTQQLPTVDGGSGPGLGARLTGAAAAGGAAVGGAAAATRAKLTGSAPEPGKYEGSVFSPDGTQPGPEYVVKGNENSMLYHTPESPSYKQTVAEIWFKTPADAERGGFQPWHRGRA